jgi:hypothetical protein
MRRGPLLLASMATAALCLGACAATGLDVAVPVSTTSTTRPVASTSTTAGGSTSTTASTSTSSTSTTRASTTTTTTAASGPWAPNGSLGSCRVFPSDNAWNRDVSALPVDANSANYINSIGSTTKLHADFGGGGAYGIPYITVPGTQPLLPIAFNAYGDESDPGPYPIPLTAPIEGDGVGDAHVLAVDRDHCRLYELYGASAGSSGWTAASGAVFDLTSNALRPEGWTSADAAGLPIFPGLARYDEVQSGHIDHALRFTVSRSQAAYLHPATHFASSSTDTSLPPMGLRLRLKAGFDLTPYHGEALVILQALKTYGMIVADNGSNWYISGASDARWDDTDLNQLKLVPGGAFEVVDTGETLRR